jgi:hypothetical protein
MPTPPIGEAQGELFPSTAIATVAREARRLAKRLERMTQPALADVVRIRGELALLERVVDAVEHHQRLLLAFARRRATPSPASPRASAPRCVVRSVGSAFRYYGSSVRWSRSTSER